MLADALISALEGLLNATLRLDPQALQRLARLQGKVICFDFSGFEQQLYFVPTAEGLQLHGRFEGEPDCRLSGSPLALARLGLAENKSGELFGGGVSIQGDGALAQRFGKILADLDIDWEEQLSRLVGDIPAHQAGRAYRSARHWAEQSRHSLELDLGEYLQEELGWLPRPEDLGHFSSGVDELRDDVERLQARVNRLLGSVAKA
jgi:ubiquinone biosynthesis protein UbiJ